jgi:hypothetical protein
MPLPDRVMHSEAVRVKLKCSEGYRKFKMLETQTINWRR